MPLETPALPMNDARTEQVRANADIILNNDRQLASFKDHIDRQFPDHQSESENFKLGEEESLDESLWNREELETPVQAIERIEEAKWPVTHEQKVEQSLQYLTDQQLLAYAVANTKAVWALKHVI